MIQYQGNGIYNVYTGKDLVVLNAEQVKEIQTIRVEGSPLDELKDIVSSLEQALDFIEDRIGNIEELIDDEETEANQLISELEAIKGEMGAVRWVEENT